MCGTVLYPSSLHLQSARNKNEIRNKSINNKSDKIPLHKDREAVLIQYSLGGHQRVVVG